MVHSMLLVAPSPSRSIFPLRQWSCQAAVNQQALQLAGVGDGGIVRMPTKEQLIAAGRKDLVAHISEAGGFLEVRLRSRLRPPFAVRAPALSLPALQLERNAGPQSAEDSMST